MNENPTKIFADALDALNQAESLRNGISAALEVFRRAGFFAKGFVANYAEAQDLWQIISAEGFSVAEFRRLENAFERIINRRFPTLADIKNDTHFEIISENPTDGKDVFSGSFLIFEGNIGGAVFIDRKSQNADFLDLLRALCEREFYLEKTLDAEKARLESEAGDKHSAAKRNFDFTNLIGNSSPMREVYGRASQMALTNSTVLLRGESGTGKQMIANAIHYNSLRAKQNFSKISFAALPAERAEDELFGTLRGKGLFETTEGGTLYLDEIFAASKELQTKICRVIKSKSFELNGKNIKINVRIIASTAHDLEKAVAETQFSSELFDVLSAFTIFLPPLRERKADILLLAEYFLEKYELIYEKRIRRISTAAIDMLAAYHFPGNVRELENVIERAVIACDSNVIHGHHLPPTLQTAEVSGTLTDVSLDAAVENFERALITDALKTTRGNRAQAAKMLSTTERIINYKIKKYDINPLRFR